MSLDRSKITELIIKNRHKVALKKMKAFASQYASSYSHEISTHQTTLDSLESDNRIGLISRDDYTRDMTRLTMKMLKLLDKLEETNTNDQPESKQKAIKEQRVEAQDVQNTPMAVTSKSKNDVGTLSFSHGYALLIGVGADLPMTAKDVGEIYEVLVNSEMAAYDTRQVKLLTNENATKQNIFNGLDWLIEQANKDPEATIFIYYSGHGGAPKIGDSSEYYLLPYDYIQSKDKQFRLSGKDWVEKINAIQAQKVLVTLDCCHAEGVLSKDEVFVKGSQELIKQLEGGKGRVVLASCKDDELSYARQHLSIFTEIFLEAMQGLASNENDEYVAVIDVVQHVLTGVPRRAKAALGRQQTPVISEIKNLDGAFTLCKHNSAVSKALKENNSTRTITPSIKVPTTISDGLKENIKTVLNMIKEYNRQLMFTDDLMEKEKIKYKIEKCQENLSYYLNQLGESNQHLSKEEALIKAKEIIDEK